MGWIRWCGNRIVSVFDDLNLSVFTAVFLGGVFVLGWGSLIGALLFRFLLWFRVRDYILYQVERSAFAGFVMASIAWLICWLLVTLIKSVL